MDEISFKYNVQGNLYQVKIIKNPVSDLIALSYFYTSLIQIVDVRTGDVVKERTGPDQNFLPEYTLSDDGRAILAKGVNYGYLDFYE